MLIMHLCNHPSSLRTRAVEAVDLRVNAAYRLCAIDYVPT